MALHRPAAIVTHITKEVCHARRELDRRRWDPPPLARPRARRPRPARAAVDRAARLARPARRCSDSLRPLIVHTAPLRVLVAGGGVAGLETMLALHALAGDRVDVELLAAEPHFWYRPLAVAEPFAAARVHRFELADLAEACRARFTLGRLDSVEPER